MFGIRRMKVRNETERLVLIMAAIVGVAESAVEILSLGRLTCDWRPNFIFSDFYERHSGLG